MNPLFCDCCGDNVKAVYPCRFIFHNGLEVPINICLDCMKKGELKIDLMKVQRLTEILIILNGSETKKWKKRGLTK